MKRSEACELILEYMAKNNLWEISADDILDLVEEIGMLPPYSEKMKFGNVWEPKDEDEKKV